MDKTLIRSYAIGTEGDLVVTSYKNGSRTDLSKEYEDVPRNRRLLREDVFLDVFRYQDGDITWSGSPNGHEPENAISFKLLLDAFVRDLDSEGSARGF
jgi:hypothetical protein